MFRLHNASLGLTWLWLAMTHTKENTNRTQLNPFPVFNMLDVLIVLALCVLNSSAHSTEQIRLDPKDRIHCDLAFKTKSLTRAVNVF